MDTVETLWADFKKPIANADDYVASLRGRGMNVFFMGERVAEPADHPVIRPSVNAMAETFRLASERPELGSVSALTSPTRLRLLQRWIVWPQNSVHLPC